MNEYLEKRMYVYRKSYNFYKNLSLYILILKLLSSAIGSVGFIYNPILSTLSLVNGVLILIERNINQNEKLSEFLIVYKFYNRILLLFKAQQITEEEINIREKDLLEHIQFFPREKYLKVTGLNGYKYIGEK